MIPPGIRIFVCTQPVDMRYGFDRLVQVAKERIGQDVVSGQVLCIFAGKNARRLKLLWLESNGLCLLYKRLHGAVFELPVGKAGEGTLRIDAGALGQLLGGVARPARVRRKKKAEQDALAP